jgi:hypothetical protein
MDHALFGLVVALGFAAAGSRFRKPSEYADKDRPKTRQQR